MEILEIKNTIRQLKNAFDRLIVDSTQPRKESGNLKIGQQNLLNVNTKRKRCVINQNRESRSYETISSGLIYV